MKRHTLNAFKLIKIYFQVLFGGCEKFYMLKGLTVAFKPFPCRALIAHRCRPVGCLPKVVMCRCQALGTFNIRTFTSASRIQFVPNPPSRLIKTLSNFFLSPTRMPSGIALDSEINSLGLCFMANHALLTFIESSLFSRRMREKEKPN